MTEKRSNLPATDIHPQAQKISSNGGHQLIDALSAAIYVTDAEGRLTHFNQAAVEFSGRTPKLGTDQWCVTWKLYHTDGTPMPHDTCPMAVAMRENRQIKGEEAIAERPDGKKIWFEAYPAPLHDSDGNLTGGINMLIDITAKKEAEKQLSRNERELKDFFENAAIGLHWVSSDGIILRANQAELDMLGYSRDEYVGQHISDFHADEQIIKNILRRLKAGDELNNYEARLRCKDGSIRHVLISSNVYRENGKFIHTRCFTLDVTGKKQTAKKLAKVTAESEQQKRLYEAIISSTPDLAYVFDHNYRFTFANNAILEMWGLTFEESIGKNLSEVGYEPWHAEMHEREIDQVIASKQSVRGEVPFKHATLGKRIYDYIFVPVINNKGEVEAVAGTTRDITELKEAEQALSKSERKYRTLFQSIDEGFCIIEMLFDENDNPVDYRFIETNPAFAGQTGLEDAEGKTMRELAPEHESFWYEVYGKVALTGESNRFERYANELGRWFNVYAFRVGEPAKRHVALIFRDITEQKNNEHLNSLLGAIVDGSDDAIISKTLDGTITSWNKGAQQLFGYSPEEAIGQSITILIPGERLDEEDNIIAQLKQGKHIKHFETIRLHKNGTPIDISLTISPVRNSAGTIVGASKIARDITLQKQAEKELQTVNETLEERVEERTTALLSYQDQLRSLVSQLSQAEENERQRLASELHDNLGQTLAIGKMKLDLLKKGQEPDQAVSDIEDLASLVNEAIRYTRELMSDLKPPPSIDKRNLADILKWLSDIMKKYDLDVTIKDDKQPKPLSKDVSSTLPQCVRELLFNVVKHAGVQKATVSVSRQEDQVQVVVADKGKGFNPEAKKSTSSEESRFGLFNVFERMDLLGGSLQIESEPGKGTKAILLAPLAESEGNKSPVSQFHHNDNFLSGEPVQSERDEKIKVLLVDDHQMMREGLRKVIEEEDDITIIAEASDGKEAIELSYQTAPDVIVMDVNMPGMGGIEATRKIISNGLPVRVIGLSLHDSDNVAQAMKNAGASAYLTKTEAFEALSATIRSEALISTRKQPLN